jgi:GntR family transcriptional regulator / MocR family aminotransferase
VAYVDSPHLKNHVVQMMNTIQKFISFDKNSEMAVYLQIANAIINSIRRGWLRKGLKLPASRELAIELKVHRKTIIASYEELLSQGWIEMKSRKGTFVAERLPDVKPSKIVLEEKLENYPSTTFFKIDEGRIILFPTRNFQNSKNLIINDGFPDVRLAPMELLMRELRTIAKGSSSRKYLMYGNPSGSPDLLEVLSASLNDSRGLTITERNIIITSGAQMGIYLAANLILKRGDHVIVGEPSYFAANLTFQQAGATLNRVPVDNDGMDMNVVERLCKTKKIRLVYVIPHHHHPTTVTLSPNRRIKLLELARKYKFAIIEDDYDFDFHYTSNPILPMASLDHHGSIIYIGTLSKTIAPAVRLGFMVAPENFIKSASSLRRGIDRQGDSLLETAVAELYKNGTMARHIKKLVKIYHERRDYFCELLRDELRHKITFKVPDGGMSVWVNFNKTDLKKLSSEVAKQGLLLSDGSAHNTDGKNYNSTRLGFASLNFKEQESAIRILRSCM